MKRTLAVLLASASLLAGCADRGAAPPAAPADSGWVARSALYEVFVRDFSPAGNLRGVIDGLDRIRATGAEVVWLMPIHPIGEVERKGSLGSPYSIRDYRGVHPDFGTPEDFRALVDAVHARGMKLILDWVPNHTAWDHPWVAAHPEYYTRDSTGAMTVPRGDDGSLTDWTDVVELDYDDPGLRRAMIGEMRYWLEEHGVDGFRVDVAGMVPDAFWREAIPELRAVREAPILLLAEWGDPRMHALGFDLTYAWDAYHRLKEVWRGGSAAGMVAREVDDHASLPDGGLRLRFTTNHDETAWDEPPVTLFGSPAGARAAFVFTALLPGPPLLYNGQEIESAQRLPLFEREPVTWDRPGGGEAVAFYRGVVELARSHADLHGGVFAAVAVEPAADVLAYRRGGVLVVVNPRPRGVTATLPNIDLDDARYLLGRAPPTADGIPLGPHGFAVLELATP